MENVMLDKIKEVTPWIPLSIVPSAGSNAQLKRERIVSFWSQFNDNYTDGVYQVSLTRPKDIIHKDIGYIGQSSKIPCRLYQLKSSAGKENKVTHHGCGVYIRHSDIDPSNVYVRVLFTDSGDKIMLEEYLHREHKLKYGYELGYAWTEASGGYKSSRIRVLSAVDRCDLATLQDIKTYIDAKIKLLKGRK